MKFIKVPALFVKLEEAKQYESMGMEDKTPSYEEEMYINTKYIISFAKTPTNNVSLVLMDGDYEIPMDFNKFLKMMEDEITD